MSIKKKIIALVAIILTIFFFFYPVPLIFNKNSTIQSVDFKDYYDRIRKKIPDNNDAKVMDFFLLFDGKSGAIQSFTVRLVVKSRLNDEIIYNIKYWPKFKVTTINSTKVTTKAKGDKKTQLSGRKLFDTFGALDYERILKDNEVAYFSLLSTLDQAERKYHKNTPFEEFVIEKGKLIRLIDEKTYPKSFEFMLIGDNHILERYLVR